MQKIKATILTALLLMAMTIALFPMANASTGQILINTTAIPSGAISVPAGGNINLYLGGVTWSGGLVYLILGNASQGFSDTAGMQYTPVMSVSDITAATTKVISGTTQYPGTWTVGQNWINGSIPQNIAGAEYFIKAFDGALTFLAVTDRTFLVTGALTIVPSSGPGGASLSIQGNAFPANGLANVSYINPVTLAVVPIQNFVAANSIGAFTIPFTAPDILGPVVNIAGDNNPAATNTITFNAKSLNETGMPVYTAMYTEGQRGVLQFGQPKSSGVTGSVQNATGVFGNLTSFSTTMGLSAGVGAGVTVGVNDKLVIAGNWFYPGSISFSWDNTILLTTATTNASGFFNVTSGITVPVTGLGLHNITMMDSNGATFIIYLDVMQSITMTPTSGPVSTTVTINGYGFPAATATHAENVTIYWDGTLGTTSGTAVAWTNPNSAGYFTLTFNVPATSGGNHNVVATSNETLTSAVKVFKVTATFFVTPNPFANDGSMITATGTGFPVGAEYCPNMDNQYMGIDAQTDGYASNIVADGAGNVTLKFIAAGFSPGLHVVSLYKSGDTTPSAYATFTVLSTGDPVMDMLTAMNTTIVSIEGKAVTIQTDLGTVKTDVASIKATVSSISGSVATVQSTVGQVYTSVSSISANIQSISNGMATITTSIGTVTAKLAEIDPVIGLIAGDTAELKTSVGTITTSLSSINTKLLSIEGNIATVRTDVGTLQGTVTSINNGMATIQTNVGTLQTSMGSLQTDVSAAKDNTAGVSTLVIVAIVLALIAAIAAVFAIFLIRQKIAS